MSKKEYDKFLDVLLMAALEFPPDMERINLLIDIAGDLNLIFDENIIVALINGCTRERIYDENYKGILDPGDGRYIPEIIELIFAHGFDSKADDIAKACWCAVAEATDGRYLLDILRVLLKAGVKIPTRIYDNMSYAEYLKLNLDAARSLRMDDFLAEQLAKTLTIIECVKK